MHMYSIQYTYVPRLTKIGYHQRVYPWVVKGKFELISGLAKLENLRIRISGLKK